MILSEDFAPDNLSQSLCGVCEKCIEKCPTNAITEPFVINSELCIAYHTIENRSQSFPKHVEKHLNGWIAGCDICQDVCPWNKTVPFNKNIEASMFLLNGTVLFQGHTSWQISQPAIHPFKCFSTCFGKL